MDLTFRDAKLSKCCFPVVLYGRRIHDKYLSTFSILGHKPLGYHYCNDSLAKANNIAKEKPVISAKELIALHHGITLVFEVANISGDIHCK